MADTPELDLEARIAECEADLVAAQEQLPTAERTYVLAFRAHEQARAVWNDFVSRLNKAVRHGAEGTDQIVPATANVQDLVDSERRKYNIAGAALTRARTELEGLKWTIEGRVLDLQQLRRLASPPKRGEHFVGTATRQKPQVDDVDSIILPSSNPRAA